MDNIAVKVDNLSYTYDGGVQALKGISFEVKQGEYIAILGANGAGKTTLSLHFNGILPVVLGGSMGGEIYILGKKPHDEHVFETAMHVGMVLQDPEAQLFSSDVLTEVAFAAENRGVEREEMYRRIDKALATVRLSEYRLASPPNLSGGQKQRLVIASNLIIRPEILVLDEPTSQLDPIGNTEVFQTLDELNTDNNMTIVIATHNINEVVDFADRILVLDQGKVILFDEPRKVFRHVPELKKALVQVTEIAEIDYHLREFANDRADVFGPPDKANIIVSEGETAVRKALEAGVLKPTGTFVKGLGRSVSEKAHESDEVVVDVKNITFRYRETDPIALENVDFSVRKGEVVGIIGQNGAGKTTLMKCIIGLLKYKEGEIKINGVNNKDMSAFEISKQVGLILQNPDNQLFQLSSEEEIGFGLKNLGLPEDEIKERTDEVLDLTGLEKFRKTYPFNLGLGDRRKLAVASIYAMHPNILIFDEPTTGQDFQGRYQLCDLAVRLNKLGATIIIISHDMSLIARYTQRVVVMGKAKILLEAPTRDAFMATDILEFDVPGAATICTTGAETQRPKYSRWDFDRRRDAELTDRSGTSEPDAGVISHDPDIGFMIFRSRRNKYGYRYSSQNHGNGVFYPQALTPIKIFCRGSVHPHSIGYFRILTTVWNDRDISCSVGIR